MKTIVFVAKELGRDIDEVLDYPIPRLLAIANTISEIYYKPKEPRTRQEIFKMMEQKRKRRLK